MHLSFACKKLLIAMFVAIQTNAVFPAQTSDYGTEQLRLLTLISSASQRIWLRSNTLTDSAILTSLNLARFRNIDLKIDIVPEKDDPTLGTWVLVDLVLYRSPFYFNDLDFFPLAIEEVVDQQVVQQYIKNFSYQVQVKKPAPEQPIAKQAVPDNPKPESIQNELPATISAPEALPKVVKTSPKRKPIVEAKASKNSSISRRLPKQTIWQKNRDLKEQFKEPQL